MKFFSETVIFKLRSAERGDSGRHSMYHGPELEKPWVFQGCARQKQNRCLI